MIVILDYGMGNCASILNMVRKAGGDAVISRDLEMIKSAKSIILPGVGSFDNGMQKLKQLEMIEVLNLKVREQKTPFLGVCLGLQLMFDKSAEGELPGLGWIKGESLKFNFQHKEGQKRLKVPHMGWNLVYPKADNILFKGLEDEARFYFVHSYHVVCEDEEDISASCEYGYKFTCAAQKENMFGVQFHPEKSHRFGLTLFRNFLEFAEC